MKKYDMTSDYLIYEQRLEQLANALNKTMDAVFDEMITQLEAELSDTARHGQDQTEWLQIGSGRFFMPYDAVRLRGDGASFSETIVEDRNQA